MLKTARKTLSNTTVIREIRVSSKYSGDSWGFVASDHGEGSVDKKLLKRLAESSGILGKSA